MYEHELAVFFLYYALPVLLTYRVLTWLSTSPGKKKKEHTDKTTRPKQSYLWPSLWRIVRWMMVMAWRKKRPLTIWWVPSLIGLYLVWNMPTEVIVYRVFVWSTLLLFCFAWIRRYKVLKGRQQEVASLPPRRGYVFGKWQEDSATDRASTYSAKHASVWRRIVAAPVSTQARDKRLPEEGALDARDVDLGDGRGQEPDGLRESGPGA